MISPLRAGIRRDSHPLHHLTKPPYWAGSQWSQGCRKNDTFSPGAWRGDERARRVPDGVPPPLPLAITRAQKSRLEGGFLVVLVGYQLK